MDGSIFLFRSVSNWRTVAWRYLLRSTWAPTVGFRGRAPVERELAQPAAEMHRATVRSEFARLRIVLVFMLGSYFVVLRGFGLRRRNVSESWVSNRSFELG